MIAARYLKLPLYVFLLVLTACNPNGNSLELDWLVGKWQINKSQSFEEWVKISNDLYQGRSYQVHDSQTSINETIEITKKDGEVFYIPTVMDQNKGKPVMFKLVSIDASEVVFENKKHDFPQRIIYVKNGDRQIDARIEGDRDGQFSKVDFQLRKVD